MGFIFRGPAPALEFIRRAAHLSARSGHPAPPPAGGAMLDLVMLAVTGGFFALALGYLVICDRF
jgi:hypothetical protein